MRKLDCDTVDPMRGAPFFAMVIGFGKTSPSPTLCQRIEVGAGDAQRRVRGERSDAGTGVDGIQHPGAHQAGGKCQNPSSYRPLSRGHVHITAFQKLQQRTGLVAANLKQVTFNGQPGTDESRLIY